MRFSLTVWNVIIMHLFWGFMLFSYGDVLRTTAINGILYFFPPYWMTAGILVLASICAIISWKIVVSKPFLALVLLMPTQFLLLMSLISVIRAMVIGKFADGVARPNAFIIVDQIYVPITVILFMLALFIHFQGREGAKTVWDSFRLPQ